MNKNLKVKVNEMRIFFPIQMIIRFFFFFWAMIWPISFDLLLFKYSSINRSKINNDDDDDDDDGHLPIEREREREII